MFLLRVCVPPFPSFAYYIISFHFTSFCLFSYCYYHHHHYIFLKSYLSTEPDMRTGNVMRCTFVVDVFIDPVIQNFRIKLISSVPTLVGFAWTSSQRRSGGG